MKSLLLSLSALIAGTAMAAAADLPQRAMPADAAVPTFRWSGFYAGVHGAFLRADGEAVRSGVSDVPPELLPARAGLGASGFGGGAQLGYLWDLGPLVAGVEADLSGMDVGRSRSYVAGADLVAVRTDLSAQMSLFGSLKGRLGVALPGFVPGVQGTLVYVTGGVALARVEPAGQITVEPLGLGPQARRDEWQSGVVIGGGTEHALTPRVSLKSETLYYHLGDRTLTLSRAGTQASYRFATDGWISRIGLNVRF